MSEAANTENLSPRVALVTGATGFVGSNLACRLVREGWQVHIVTRPGSKLPAAPEFSRVTAHAHDGTTEGMIRLVAAARPGVVFHVASLFLSGHTARDIAPLIQSNVLFATQLVEAMDENGVRCLINTGTSWQHFENRDYSPVNLYAATKQAFEAILQYYVEAKSLNVITLKLFDTYGPNDPRPKLLHLLEKTARSKEPLAMSPGEQLIDLVHIDDVIDAYLLAADQVRQPAYAGHHAYAVTSGRPLRLKDLASIYGDATGTPVPIQWGGRPYRPREVMNPWDKGETLPGWKPRIPLEEGFARLARHEPH